MADWMLRLKKIFLIGLPSLFFLLSHLSGVDRFLLPMQRGFARSTSTCWTPGGSRMVCHRIRLAISLRLPLRRSLVAPKPQCRTFRIGGTSKFPMRGTSGEKSFADSAFADELGDRGRAGPYAELGEHATQGGAHSPCTGLQNGTGSLIQITFRNQARVSVRTSVPGVQEWAELSDGPDASARPRIKQSLVRL
jgi:hypothetical protein